MTEREMPCMGQTRCFFRPIISWLPFIKKKQYYKKIEENFTVANLATDFFFTVAKPKFTVANGDHSVANVKPCSGCQKAHLQAKTFHMGRGIKTRRVKSGNLNYRGVSTQHERAQA